MDVRKGVSGLAARSQSSLAVSIDSANWCLLNASPDLRQQIAECPALYPSGETLRSSPIRSVVLTNADVDHVAGLLNLRELQSFHLYGSARVLAAVSANPIFGVLREDLVIRQTIENGTSFQPAGCPGLEIEMFTVPGKVALYLENAEAGPDFGSAEGDVVGLRLSDTATGRTAYYIPGCAEVTGDLLRRIDSAAALLFDGTLYTDDEMLAQGLTHKTGRRMGHISISGEDGSIARLAGAKIGRRIFIHINNSNPVLRDDSPERAAVEAAGWQVAHDGMEFRL